MPVATSTDQASADWLEIIDGASPFVLIAPHGGRAGVASRSILHPKVNDLHTCDITRELARLLDASALINHGMDRNQLDCNRLSQLGTGAPWLLDLIANRVEQSAGRHGRAIVLLIHGWNIIEPRVDLGLGLRMNGRELAPAGRAFVSATDGFINNALSELVGRLAAENISASFGMRYPGGGKENLLQAFTKRFLQAPVAALRRLAQISAAELVEAVQLELSVAVRWPGAWRESCLRALAQTFRGSPISPAHSGRTYSIVRGSEPLRQKVSRPLATAPIASRYGVEFCDRSGRLAAMASIDVGLKNGGGRLMVLTDRGVLLCTAEGRVEATSRRLHLGPLEFTSDDDRQIALEFNGPAITVPDPASYVSIERALASGSLSQDVKLKARLVLDSGSSARLAQSKGLPMLSQDSSLTAFGKLRGYLTIDGHRTEVQSTCRIGHSLSGIGNSAFRERRMFWVTFADRPDVQAVEGRIVSNETSQSETEHGREPERTARVFTHADISSCNLEQIDFEGDDSNHPPARIQATLKSPDGLEMLIRGETTRFVLLSRPGPELSRIRTCLGFATYRMGDSRGAGMFEWSTRSDACDFCPPQDDVN
jgi:hypothetical protein